MKKNIVWIFLIIAVSLLAIFFIFPKFFGDVVSYKKDNGEVKQEKPPAPIVPLLPPLDIVAYEKKTNELANNPPDPIVYQTVKTVTKDKNGKPVTKTTKVPVSPQPVRTHLWPATAVYPNAGALLPFNRIVAYYGNLSSKSMGVLGQYPEDEMLAKLNVEVEKWNVADPSTPAIPALHYIAVVAQGSAGKDGKYRTRMPFSEIDKVLAIAAKIPARNASGIADAGGNIFTEIVGRGGGNFEMVMPKDLTLAKGDQAVLPGIVPYVLGIVETTISDPRDPFQKALLVSPVNIQELKFVEVEK